MLLTYQSGPVATVTLNRPDKRNALAPELIAAIHKAFTELAQDPDIRVILLNANGKAFCAGADLDHLQKLTKFTKEENLQDSRQLKDMYLAIYNSPKLVIAAVDGPAVAGGCGLASMADVVYASPNAQFGYPETRIGFLPAIVAVFGSARFPGAHLQQLLLTGRLFAADEGMRLGLVSEIIRPTEADNFDQQVKARCQELAYVTSPESIRRTKALLRHMDNPILLEQLEYACQANADARATADFAKGVRSVLTRQPLYWA